MNSSFKSVYSLKKRLIYTLLALLAAIVLAGFWNYHLVDGFGKDFVTGGTIGDAAQLSAEYDTRGMDFGFLFAAIAGLAATFTACNCVVFAMIPGLACSVDTKGKDISVWKAFRSFTYGVLLITAFYGFFIGFLGREGVELINQRSIRLGQAQAVFSSLGLLMLLWGAFEMGYLDSLKNRLSKTTRNFLAQTTVKAHILGLMVGLFAVGRPFPVFRDFLVYAASASNPFYGSIVMMIQGLGQIAVMALIFFLVVWIAGDKIGTVAIEKPYKFRMVSGIALITGGMFFVYYWGLAFVFDIGRWGFKLGWY